MSKIKFILPLFALALFVFSGCNSTEGGGTEGEGSGGTATAGGGDEQDHDHPAHGPHGGHMIEWEGTHDLHAEWKHYSDNDVIRFYVLDDSGKNDKAVKADSFTVRRASGDEEVFDLVAEDPNEAGEAVVYSLDSKGLAMAMVLGTKVEMKVGDKTYSASIAAHEPHDH